jgi:hypothetical protein
VEAGEVFGNDAGYNRGQGGKMHPAGGHDCAGGGYTVFPAEKIRHAGSGALEYMDLLGLACDLLRCMPGGHSDGLLGRSGIGRRPLAGDSEQAFQTGNSGIWEKNLDNHRYACEIEQNYFEKNKFFQKKLFPTGRKWVTIMKDKMPD